MPGAAPIIRHIESIGYVVSVQRVNGTVELQAVKIAQTEPKARIEAGALSPR